MKVLIDENTQARGYIGQLESTLNLINSQQAEVSIYSFWVVLESV